ncbi:Predicted arabinose efflux permease, MFS family [Nonomuraea maritima]|uniref:Predicted arabinose efflux permease, MFS family n=1 Tax=Nonomuraea maritima TaxID=683260 RepID=A0A1G9QFS1_9ACTN|nr:MFS transporter [Nonomuraea maritima]SDM09155.1 Predicted arabinose efflux permease, MFS family [Nonomuraea maritima]
MLVASLYAYAFVGEFMLIYPVYTLLFHDTGLSVAETSSLFVIWAVTGMVLEVPSGAWADTVSRRLLLVLGPLLAGLGFALWVAFPSYWAFALGFVLWGAEGALVSGSYEALAYEELERRGQAHRYAGVMGRATSLGLVADAAAIGLAAPVLAAGGYPAVGVATVVASVACACVALTLPEHRTPAAAGEGRYLTILREGVALARADRGVLNAVLLVAFVTAIWGALEEYIPYLALETGVAKTAVPLVVLLVWLGVTAGGLLGDAAQRLPARAYGLMLGLAAAAMVAGALAGHPAGFVLIALAFGAFQLAGVLADVRLQERITGPARATVTSLGGIGANVVTLGVYATYGAASPYATHGVLFALLTLPYLLIAVLVARRRPYTARP